MPDGGGGDSGPPQDSPAGDQTSSTDVNGKVIDELGFPAPNVKLSIASATTTTAADGTFKLSAPPTYNIALAYDSGTTTTNKRMQAFLGLTTRTPTLQIIQQIKRSGTATVSNTNLTVANGERVGFLIAPTSNSSQTNEFLGPLNFATGMLSLFWNQETPLVGKVYALHYKTPAMSPTDNPIPTSFLHADAQSFPSLADKGNVALSTWSFASGVTVMMNVTIDYNGAAGKGLSLLYRPDPRGAFSFDDLAFTGQTNATYAIPGGSGS